MIDPDRRARERANLARHLNQNYPDTLLLIAVALGGAADATEAELLSLEETSLVLAVTTEAQPGGAEQVSVTLPGEADEPLRQRVATVVRHARAKAPDRPATGMERMLGDHDNAGRPVHGHPRPDRG